MASKTIDVNGTTVDASETTTATTTTLEQMASTPSTFTEITPGVSTISYDQVNSLETDAGFTVPADQVLESVTITYTIDNVVETLSVHNNSDTTPQTLNSFKLLINDTTYDPSGVNANGTTPDASAINDALPSNMSNGELLYKIGTTTFAPSQETNYIGGSGGSAPVSTLDSASITSANPNAYFGTSFYTINYSTLVSELISGGGGNLKFSSTVKSSSTIDIKYNFEAVCYAEGTKILSARGEVAVEDLRVGDLLVTFSGKGATLKPVRWIGHRRLDAARTDTPDDIHPVRIMAGAFADNLPHRDLLVSPAHAVYAEGVLIPARSLINGATVVQDRTISQVHYLHIELHMHNVLLAEGLPAESYVECGNRRFFYNDAGPVDLHGLPDMEAPAAAYCAPLVPEGAEVSAVRSRLVARARATGIPVTRDVMPRLVVDGRVVQPAKISETVLRFDVPVGANEVKLVSAAGRPIDVNPDTLDWRTLGTAVAALVEVKDDFRRTIELTDTRLYEGWHAIEGDGEGAFRWTDGAAELPLIAGSLEVTVRDTALIWADVEKTQPTVRRAA